MPYPLSENINRIQGKIAQACARSGRHPDQVRLVAVSKTKPASDVLAALAAGQGLFGENRVQEARDKIPQVAAGAPSQRVQWHLIGPLQRNKIKVAIPLFSMIHSIDSLPLAETLSAQVPDANPLPVLIQVNVGGEPQKKGFSPQKLDDAIEKMAVLKGIRIQGLMTVPPFLPDPESVRPYFQELARLADAIRCRGIDDINMTELSMGMSHDYPVAVEEGATLVRVGSALFGHRE